jgi:CheY-like chemotaxis protein
MVEKPPASCLSKDRPGEQRAVLLVDDSADTLEMYSLGLSQAGYRPLTASDADGALRKLSKEHPAAVITDLRLVGGAGGWELIDTIKRNPSTRQIPIVILTGQIDDSIATDAHRMGCVAVLTKPCLPDDLAHVLDRVLRP